MNDLCLKFDSELQAQQVLTDCGLAVFVPEHTVTVPAHTEERQEPIEDETLEAELNATAPDASTWTRIVLHGETYLCMVETETDEYGADIGEYRSWYHLTTVDVPETTRTVPASIVGAGSTRIDVIGPLSRPIGEPDADGTQPTQQLPGWHVNVLCADVPEALQPYIVVPARRVRVWA